MTTLTYRLRLAAASDAEAICRIYNQGIEDRIATLETELRTPDERRQWLANHSPRHPVIVAENGSGDITAWASLNVFNAREAYRFVADISVYVERGRRGTGVGRVLLEKLGFRTVGTYREQGQLDGKWVDTIIMEKLL